ncbi:MAG: reverse transcriptase domain-containing protein [Sedimenticola sp.]
MKRGVRQGCPISSYICILCIEILSRKIDNNEHIVGLSLGGNQIKQTLFADDASFLLNGSENEFTELIKTLEKLLKNIGPNIK